MRPTRKGFLLVLKLSSEISYMPLSHNEDSLSCSQDLVFRGLSESNVYIDSLKNLSHPGCLDAESGHQLFLQ